MTASIRKASTLFTECRAVSGIGGTLHTRRVAAALGIRQAKRVVAGGSPNRSSEGLITPHEAGRGGSWRPSESIKLTQNSVSLCGVLASCPGRVLASGPPVASSCRVLLSCCVFVSWPRVMCSCCVLVLVSSPRFVSSCHVLKLCLRVVSSRRVLLAETGDPCLHLGSWLLSGFHDLMRPLYCLVFKHEHLCQKP